MLKIFKLRDYFEILLYGLNHWLSCILDCIHVCVFLLSKNCFEKLARHLLDTLLSVELLKPFSYCNPDTSSIPGGSIKKAPASSIAPRYLVDRSSFCSWIWFLVARYLSCRRPFSRHLHRHLSKHHLSSITEESIYTSSCDPFLISSICPCLFISQTLSFHFNHVPQGFFKLFQVFLHLVSF